jgi:Spy/CpxP family protein refolding chaperone
LRRAPAGLLLLLAATAASAQAAGAEGKWWKRPRIADALALTSPQVSDLEKIFARSKPKLIDLRADLEKKQFDYEQAMSNDKIDRKAVEAKIEAREQARAALQKELSLMELDMKQVLNPEQREKLMRMRENAKLQMQQRRRRLRDDAGEGDGFEAPPPANKKPASF